MLMQFVSSSSEDHKPTVRLRQNIPTSSSGTMPPTSFARLEFHF
jgi:hypothetical protein